MNYIGPGGLKGELAPAKRMMLAALQKAQDHATVQRAETEIVQIISSIQTPDELAGVVQAITGIRSGPPLGRKTAVKALTSLCQVQGKRVVPHVPKICGFLVSQAAEDDSTAVLCAEAFRSLCTNVDQSGAVLLTQALVKTPSQQRDGLYACLCGCGDCGCPLDSEKLLQLGDTSEAALVLYSRLPIDQRAVQAGMRGTSEKRWQTRVQAYGLLAIAAAAPNVDASVVDAIRRTCEKGRSDRIAQVRDAASAALGSISSSHKPVEVNRVHYNVSPGPDVSGGMDSGYEDSGRSGGNANQQASPMQPIQQQQHHHQQGGKSQSVPRRQSSREMEPQPAPAPGRYIGQQQQQQQPQVQQQMLMPKMRAALHPVLDEPLAPISSSALSPSLPDQAQYTPITSHGGSPAKASEVVGLIEQVTTLSSFMKEAITILNGRIDTLEKRLSSTERNIEMKMLDLERKVDEASLHKPTQPSQQHQVQGHAQCDSPAKTPRKSGDDEGGVNGEIQRLMELTRSPVRISSDADAQVVGFVTAHKDRLLKANSQVLGSLITRLTQILSSGTFVEQILPILREFLALSIDIPSNVKNSLLEILSMMTADSPLYYTAQSITKLLR